MLYTRAQAGEPVTWRPARARRPTSAAAARRRPLRLAWPGPAVPAAWGPARVCQPHGGRPALHWHVWHWHFDCHLRWQCHIWNSHHLDENQNIRTYQFMLIQTSLTWPMDKRVCTGMKFSPKVYHAIITVHTSMYSNILLIKV